MLASHTLALSFGDVRVAPRVEDWAALYAFAVQERCAALMWQRGGAAIRSHAPPDVVTEWRKEALAVAEHGSALLALLAETQALLDAASIESIALKGAPLALRLYGSPIARPVVDLDLFIPAEQRQRAREVLRAAGWLQVEGGTGTAWEVLMRMDGDEKRYLDLLSHVPKHLPRANAPTPGSEVGLFDGLQVRIHAGPGVPNHLAVHLAKHEFPPLLWFVDFATAWDAMNPAEREVATTHARDLQTHQYLQWAVDRAGAARRAGSGDPEALSLLGFTSTGRIQPRRWRRELALAGSVSGAIRLLLRWIFPLSARTPAAWLRRLAQRVRHPHRWLMDRRTFEQ